MKPENQYIIISYLRFNKFIEDFLTILDWATLSYGSYVVETVSQGTTELAPRNVLHRVFIPGRRFKMLKLPFPLFHDCIQSVAFFI